MLEKVKLPALVDLMQETSKGSDALDNTELQALQNDHHLMSIRINTLRDALVGALLIEPNGLGDVVQLGSTVTVQEHGEESEAYQIVGSAEADPEAGLISNVSPLGQALIGRKTGDTITLETDGGIIVYRLICIQPTG